MAPRLNEEIATKLDEVAEILSHQGANRFRIHAYHHAADVLRGLARSVVDIFTGSGLAGLEEIPGVGETIAHAIKDILLHGRLAMLDRLRGEGDPIALLTTVPGVGKKLAWKLHEDLGIETLEELESAAHDGRLENDAGIGAKRLAGIRDSLAHRLGRIRQQPPGGVPTVEPSVEELLGVDCEYRREAEAGSLKKIAPRRFNPTGEAWLPVLHTARGSRHYSALFSNTARAHEKGKTGDWVVLYYDGAQGEQRSTVITSEFGQLKGLRIIRGREDECAAHYQATGELPPVFKNSAVPRLET